MPIVILGLAVAGLATVWSQSELDRNIQAWLVGIVVILSCLLGAFWFLFLSRFPWRLRLGVTALVVLAVIGLRQAVRVDGTTDGRGLPRLVWKWSKPKPPAGPLPAVASAPESPGSSTATGAAPATAQTAQAGQRDVPVGLKDVPQFFGPNRDGRITGAGLARDWTTQPPRELWRQPIGPAWSAFAVVGGYALTQEQRGEDECVTCYEALTGRLVWSQANRTRFFQWQAGEGPHATPTVDRGRVFAYGATGRLDCLDLATGQRIWSRSVLSENQLENLEWGTSASPLVYDDLVVVTGGKGPGPTVLAFDRETGEPRWRSGTDRASYASPILARLAGQLVVVSFNAGTLTAHDATTGTLRLEQRWGNDKPPKAAQPVVLDGDRLFVSAGYGMGCELFQATAGAEGALALASIWKGPRMKAQFNSVAVRDGFFYGLDDGRLACVAVDSGERAWKDGRFGSGQTLVVDDLVLIQAESGPVVLAEAKPEAYRELGRIPALSSKTWNHPTLAGRYLFVRNDREAVAYELPLQRP